MWCHHSYFFGHCTPLDPWDLDPDFRPWYLLIEDIAFTGLNSVWKKVVDLLNIVSLKARSFARKMHWNLFSVLWMFFCFEQFEEDVESNKSVVRLSVERVWSSAAHNFRRPTSCASSAVVRQKPQRPTRPGKPPEAERRSTGRRGPARSRLQSSCCRKEPRWMPRTTVARGLRGRARNPVSNLGHLKKVFKIEIHEKNICTCRKLFEKSCGLAPQDHNATWYGSGHVSMNDRSSKQFRIVSAKLRR